MSNNNVSEKRKIKLVFSTGDSRIGNIERDAYIDVPVEVQSLVLQAVSINDNKNTTETDGVLNPDYRYVNVPLVLSWSQVYELKNKISKVLKMVAKDDEMYKSGNDIVRGIIESDINVIHERQIKLVDDKSQKVFSTY